MTPTFASFTIVFSLLAGDGLGGDSRPPPPIRRRHLFQSSMRHRLGSRAHRMRFAAAVRPSRIELDDADPTTQCRPGTGSPTSTAAPACESSSTTPPPLQILTPTSLHSENVAWRLANKVAGSRQNSTASDELPAWARFRTGNDTGPSAGLMFTLAYIDAAHTRSACRQPTGGRHRWHRSRRSRVPCVDLEVKVAAAMLARPDVVFTPSRRSRTEHVTIVESSPPASRPAATPSANGST